ncbi:OmpA family protein [uncultured Tateyamaria sp.]|uniref:OmpA family protein n=1 Tax=Tateyamaria sp. 1078 TaxID=3417464 RepID=UPI00260E62DA|nr:OmpA family protein [uncultured Tateyamaria sp.]
MRMLRSAGLSLASADRLANAQRGSSVGRAVLGGVAVLALAGAGVMAVNMPALTAADAPAVAEAAAVVPEPMPVPVVEPEPEIIPVATALDDQPPEIQQPTAEELPWVKAAAVDAPVQEISCLSTLAASLAGISLQFDPGSAQVRPGDYDTLLSIGADTAACPEARVLVAGHSDSSGSDAINMQLSWERADQTLQTMDRLGIDISQFETVGFGARAPLTQGSSTDEEINRRVELRVIKDGGQL